MSDPGATSRAVPAAPVPAAPTGSKVAVGLLVALVVLSPWPFGSASLRTTHAIALLGLLTSLALCIRPGRDGRTALPYEFPWPVLALWLLVAFQLVPLPRQLHLWLAPGSAAIWYPAEPAAAQVLGEGPHPLSVFPEATARWFAFTIGVVSLVLLAAPALRDRRRALRASLVVVAGGVTVAVYSLVARLFCGDKLYCIFSVPTIAPFGPFVSKNHFSGYVEMAALLAIGVVAGLADEARTGPERLSWIESPRAARVLLAWTAPVILVLAVPVSLSRGGVVSLAVGLLTFALLRARGGARRGAPVRRGVLALAVLALGGAGLAAILPPSARTRVLTLGGVTAEPSGAYRLAVWRDSLRLATSSPGLGSGFGAYADAIPRFKTAAGDLRVEHAENDYVEAFGEGGAVGALLLARLACALVVRGLRGIRDEPHRGPRGLRAGALAGIVALLVHSTFDFNLRIPSNALLFAMLAALVLAPVSAPARRSRWRHWAMELVLVVGVAVALATPWRESSLDVGDVTRAARSGPARLRWAAVEDDVVSHLRRRPADAVAWVTLAWLRVPRSTPEAAGLARWGIKLDPQREKLRSAAEGLAKADRGGSRPAGEPSR